MDDDQGPRLHHRDGVWWYDAPVPRRLHFCTGWTSGFMSDGGFAERCACGAIRLTAAGEPTVRRPFGAPWLERNSRRHARRERSPR